MKLTELKKGDLASVVDIYLEKNLKIHLMEMGLVKDTKVKIVRITKNKQMITIFFRNYEISLDKTIADNIMVIK